MMALVLPLLMWQSATAEVPDPTQLMPAEFQVPNTFAYGLLNVPGMAAGSFYLDPVTQVKIYKLTSGSFPATGYSWGHAYAEGGDEVSLLYTPDPIQYPNKHVRTIHLMALDGFHWLIDFEPATGLVSNGRQITTYKPHNETSFSFSNNPDTPGYAYVGDDLGRLWKMDVASWSPTPGVNPIYSDSAHTTGILWLHQSKKDERFVWMYENIDVPKTASSQTTIVGYTPLNGAHRTYSENYVYSVLYQAWLPTINEPRIDRDGRYIGLSMNDANKGKFLDWDRDPGNVTFTTPPSEWQTDGVIPFAHIASLRGRWVGEDWNMSYPPDFSMFTPTSPGMTVAHLLPGPANASLFHGDGNWIQYPIDLGDQWAVVYDYGELRPPTKTWTGDPPDWLAPGGMIAITPNGQRFLVGHPYNTTAAYNFYSFAKFAPDGKYVLFTSNMNAPPCGNTACYSSCWMDGTHYNLLTTAVRTTKQQPICAPHTGGCVTQPCGRSDVFLAVMPTKATSIQTVSWTSVVNASGPENSLVKTAGCDGCDDAGAVSQQSIASGDGYVEFTAGGTNTTRAAGLGNGNTNTSLADIKFAIVLWLNASAAVYENGSYVVDIGSYNATDVFRVAVEGGVVKYYKNGNLACPPSALTPTYPLLMDTSLWGAGSPINNAIISGAL
jgi:hypothetical protein